MLFPVQCRWLVMIILMGMGVGLASAQTSAPAASRERAIVNRPASGDLQQLMQQVNVQRDKMIADHEALAKQLKEATDEKRKQILEQMQEQKKNFEAAQSALHKQIRDEQRRLRLNSAPDKR